MRAPNPNTGEIHKEVFMRVQARLPRYLTAEKYLGIKKLEGKKYVTVSNEKGMQALSIEINERGKLRLIDHGASIGVWKERVSAAIFKPRFPSEFFKSKLHLGLPEIGDFERQRRLPLPFRGKLKNESVGWGEMIRDLQPSG